MKTHILPNTVESALNTLNTLQIGADYNSLCYTQQ
jgi:hypothetical protein